MTMFWNIRRRPSKFVQLLRAALMVGAVVAVPACFAVVRRLILREKPSSRSGGGIAAKAQGIARDMLSNGSRSRRRHAASARS